MSYMYECKHACCYVCPNSTSTCPQKQQQCQAICRHDDVSNAEIMDSGDRTAFTKATAYICALIVISYVGPDVD